MEQTLKHLRANRAANLETLKRYLEFPSVSANPQRAGDISRCADFTAKLLKQAGLDEVAVHPTPGHPLVTAAWRGAPGKPTVLIYGHYDVQPEDPLDAWEQPPFAPWIKNDRIIARGSADDKGQILMHIQAIEAMRRENRPLPVNVVFLIEGEEEIGSPNLPPFIQTHQKDLQADICLVSDSAMWSTEIPAITMGLRGLVVMEVTVTGPSLDLHSGTYGGAVANPLEALSRMIASLKDDQGRIQVPGFYDRVQPITEAERRDLEEIPFDEKAYLKKIGLDIGWGEEGHTLLEQLWYRPTLEINGLWGGFTGAGIKTVLPSQAHAKITLRLVPDQDPAEMADLVLEHLRRIAPPWVSVEANRLPGGGSAVVVPREIPAMAAATQALTESFGHKPLFIREGGSIPVVAEFKNLLNAYTLLIGFSPPNAKTHSPNENFHLPTFHTGTESLVRLLHHLGEQNPSA
ncbi:MAG: dipeptidase [Magnetococcales bacterium]|nr:dipeptidase [Magnetococcales bacterium]